MTNRRAIFLNARREVIEGVRTRAMQISTAVQVLIVVAIVVVAAIASGDDTEKFNVGYVGTEAKAVAEAAEGAADGFAAEVTPKAFDDEAAAESAVDGDDVDAALVGDPDLRIVTGSSPSDTLLALLQTAARDARGSEALRAEGISEEKIAAALEPPPLEVTELGGDSAGAGIAWVGSLLLYIAILSFGYAVASAVVAEKSTRVVEVILSAIRPIQLLTGKVIGIGILGLGQVLLIAGIGAATGFATGAIEMPASTPEVLLLVLVYFLLGYLLYAAAFAVAGAMVSRQEDVQSAAAPLSIVLVAAYLIGITAIDKPEGTLAVVASLVPLTAPMVVPGRAAQDALPLGELALSLALMVVGAALVLWLAARVYDRAVLRMGRPLRLAETLRLARQRND